MKVLWTNLAYKRLEEIYSYIEEDSPTSAARWADKLLKKVNGIKDFPRAGRSIPEVDAESIREIIFGNYRIIYRIREEIAYILRVRHFKQILPLEDIEE